MRCKCKICGKELDTKTAFLITNGPSRLYYCSKAEYEGGIDAYNKKKAEEEKVYKLVCKILNENEIVSNALKTEWIEWNKVATNIKITQYLEVNYDALVKKMQFIKKKGSSSLSSLIRYLSAIIKDQISSFEMQKDMVVPIDYSSYNLITNEQAYKRKKRSVEEMLLDYEKLTECD